MITFYFLALWWSHEPDYPLPVFKRSMNNITIINLQPDESAEWQEHVLVCDHHPPIWVEEESYFPENPNLKTLNKYVNVIT